MISGLLGGPYVGIPVGIISGLWRFSMGGPTGLACAVGTIIAGIVGGVVHKWNGGEFLRSYKAGILMFLYCGFDMFLITVLTPLPDGIIIAETLYAPMTFAAVLGMLLFTLFLDEKKDESDDELKQTIDDNASKISDGDVVDINNDKIIELSQELEDYKNKVQESELELKEYKNKVDNLERKLNDIKGKL